MNCGASELISFCHSDIFVCSDKNLVFIDDKILRFCDTGSANGATNSQS